MVFNAKKQGESMMKKFTKFRNLIIEMLEEDNEILSTMINIQNNVFALSKEKKYKVIKILRRCASDLKNEVC
jgi:hypothetical protein